MNFNDFYWHDSIVKNISIDRSSPGIDDSIKLEIEWADGGNIELVFQEVYWANMMLNFGVIAEETILSASVGDDKDLDLVNLYSKWKGLLGDINLNSYVINLNSTGSVIKIIAKKFKIIEK